MSGPASGVRPDQRVTPDNPCPVCGGHDRAPRGQGERCFGFFSENGDWAHCTREEFAGDLLPNAGSGAYAHKLAGACNCGVSHDYGATVYDFRAREDKRTPRRKESQRRKIVKTYDYTDERGNFLFQVVRYEPKGFSQRRPSEAGNGNWEWNLQGVRRVLYRLPELLAADLAETVFIFEGEEDVDRAREGGLVATTNPHGAGKWRDEYSSYLEGSPVAVVADNDPEGHNHAEEVARSVYPLASSVKVLHLPDLRNTEDYGDWLNKYGGSPEELIVRAKGAPVWSSPSTNGLQTHGNSGEHTPPPRARNTDMGNAERFTAQHGENVRYCFLWGKWLVWTGSRWEIDDSGYIYELAKETVKSVYVEAGNAQTDEERKALAAHARRSESANAIEAMLRLTRSDVPVSPEDLDSHPHLLNAPNGTVDLTTGEIREHRREDLLTKVTGADYRPDTPAPTWEAFLERVQPNTSVRGFIQRASGYSATGDTSEQCMFINHGEGANGKSTFQEALSDALGDYATRTPTDMLMARRFNGVPNDVARLKGARFVAAAETEEGRRLDEARIKDLTGQDTVTARFMRGEWFDFSPTHKLHLSTNHKPEIRGTDNAIWRRIRLIPWSVTVPPAEQDKKLPEKLRRELVGILAWTVAGCLQWRREGLKAPEEVRKATGEYRADMDVLAAFLREECATVEGESTKATRLYESYREWCLEAGEKAEKQRKFGERLKERGYEKQRITSGADKGKYQYLNIVLLRNPRGGPDGEPFGSKHSIGEQLEGASEASEVPTGSNQTQAEVTSVQEGGSGEQSFTESFTTGNPSKSQGKEGAIGRSGEQSEPKININSSENPRKELIRKKGSLHSLRSPKEEEEPDIEGLSAMFEEGGE